MSCPDSCAINPNPRLLSNHLTLPLAIADSFRAYVPGNRKDIRSSLCPGLNKIRPLFMPPSCCFSPATLEISFNLVKTNLQKINKVHQTARILSPEFLSLAGSQRLTR